MPLRSFSLSRRFFRPGLMSVLGLVFSGFLLEVLHQDYALATTPTGKHPRVLVLDEARVYFPAMIRKNDVFLRPATVETGTVFGSIREWLEIKRRKLTVKDAEYHLLLKAANERFTKAIRQVQKDGSFDVIAEKGALKVDNVSTTDATRTTVESISAE